MCFGRMLLQTGIVNALSAHHNKDTRQHTFFSGFRVTASSAFFTTSLAYGRY